MTEARQKAEESRTLREIWKRFEGQTFSFGKTELALCKAYEDAIRSREQELEKLREMAKEVIAVGQPYLEDCDIIGMKDGGWKAKMPKLSQWLSVCSKAAKWKSALPGAPKEGR